MPFRSTHYLPVPPAQSSVGTTQGKPGAPYSRPMQALSCAFRKGPAHDIRSVTHPGEATTNKGVVTVLSAGYAKSCPYRSTGAVGVGGHGKEILPHKLTASTHGYGGHSHLLVGKHDQGSHSAYSTMGKSVSTKAIMTQTGDKVLSLTRSISLTVDDHTAATAPPKCDAPRQSSDHPDMPIPTGQSAHSRRPNLTLQAVREPITVPITHHRGSSPMGMDLDTHDHKPHEWTASTSAPSSTSSEEDSEGGSSGRFGESAALCAHLPPHKPGITRAISYGGSSVSSGQDTAMVEGESAGMLLGYPSTPTMSGTPSTPSSPFPGIDLFGVPDQPAEVLREINAIAETLLMDPEQLQLIRDAPNAIKGCYRSEVDCTINPDMCDASMDQSPPTPSRSPGGGGGPTTTDQPAGQGSPAHTQPMRTAPITARDRRKVVQWMSEVCQSLRWQMKTFLTSVNALDRFLKYSTQPIQTAHLPVLSVACLFIGAGLQEYFEDRSVPQLSAFVRAAPYLRSVHQVKTIQLDIMDTLSGRFLLKTPIDFAVLYLSSLKHHPDLTYFRMYDAIASRGYLPMIIEVIVCVLGAACMRGTHVSVPGSHLVAATLIQLIQYVEPSLIPVSIHRELCADVFKLEYSSLLNRMHYDESESTNGDSDASSMTDSGQLGGAEGDMGIIAEGVNVMEIAHKLIHLVIHSQHLDDPDVRTKLLETTQQEGATYLLRHRHRRTP
ncbi:unnamed protein product [Vitrella brassicaformis CCMP3155]|uniref:Cyclin-like domain-containing protein n=1 Tax=Vitrella brassicaformis (strain CCMP3155) TaxID=1169540 RepID=A0A0G4GRL4_VITBC|nr:unnamed protein product [Vitrella brassicaformis CCMP3155]|mmetsp:Transcript_43505/g.108653  ORF Transcript_43505/g.108653 Transcript_43505/m.108653 type:complete len:721 (-) Transcript_43505:784-2946(-)|eukprot:CEM33193.1 unnamed protein product [Vitrella brassicaformis CCMP3155]